jgi:uncharacterized protein YbcI
LCTAHNGDRLCNGLVGIHNRYLGRGPKTASTFHYGNVLVTLMHDVLTHAEKSLTDKGQIAAVDHIRHLFQETTEADFREAVERLTGRKVLALISGNHIDPDIAATWRSIRMPLACSMIAPVRSAPCMRLNSA